MEPAESASGTNSDNAQDTTSPAYAPSEKSALSRGTSGGHEEGSPAMEARGDRGKPPFNKPNGTGDASDGRGKMVAVAAVLFFLVLLMMGLLPRLRHNRALNNEAKDEATTIPPVEFVTPHPGPTPDLTLPGNTQAIEDTTIAARTSGYLRHRYVDIGSHVHAGQVLADIESPEVDQQLAQANAQTAQSQAAVGQAQADVANKQAVVKQNQSNVQQARANLEQSRSQIANAEAKLAQSRANESNAEAKLKEARQMVEIKRAALAQSKTQLNLASVTLQRYETLLKQGFVALQDVDQSQANYNNALAAVHSAEADISGAEANVQALGDTVQGAQADVAASKAVVAAAQKNVKAVDATVSAAGATVTAAEAGVRQSRETVKANRYTVASSQANERRYHVLTSFEKVVAPFDGVITARNVDTGALVNAGGGAASSSGSSGGTANATLTGTAGTASASPTATPGTGLFGLAKTDTLRILVSVPQAFSRLIQVGQKTNITLHEYPGRVFEGLVHNISGGMDAASRTLLTEVYLPNKEGTLLPGMYTQVRFLLPDAHTLPRIPANTLMIDSQGTRVAAITPKNKVHFVLVRIERDYGKEVDISEGITGQERLIINPTDDLFEGMAVKPTPTPPDTTAGPSGNTKDQPAVGHKGNDAPPPPK